MRARVLLWLLLLPHLVCKPDTIMCSKKEAFHIVPQWNQPGDIVVGGIATYIGYTFPIISFKTHPSMEPENDLIVMTKFYQHILALVFAVNEINDNHKILPNVTLGFHIYDSFYDARKTYRTTLNLLFKSHNSLPNYKCGPKNDIAGVIGGLNSDISSRMADILTLFKIPQFSYGSFEPVEGDRTHFPSFYRMVPNEALQYQGIIQLLLHFKWKWVGILISSDGGGEHLLHNLETLLYQNGICPAFIEILTETLRFSDFEQVFSLSLSKIPFLLERKINAFVVYGEVTSIIWLAAILWVTTTLLPLSDSIYKGEISVGKVWITTAQIDFIFIMIQRSWDIQMFHGALSFTIHSKELPGFQTFLQKVNPLRTKADGFIKDFWEQAFECTFFLNPNSSITDNKLCSGEERLENLPGPVFEMGMTGHSYNIYNAVYAVAHTLHAFYSSRSSLREIQKGGTVASSDVDPWQEIGSQINVQRGLNGGGNCKNMH